MKMTNDERAMSKELTTSRREGTAVRGYRFLVISRSFVIRHSSFVIGVGGPYIA
jgi:hypothetical protein